MRPTYPVAELMGDGIGPELSRAVHRLAEALPVRLDFIPVDFTLESRRARGQALYDEAIETITDARVALKHPTTTAEESPNAPGRIWNRALREQDRNPTRCDRLRTAIRGAEPTFTLSAERQD